MNIMNSAEDKIVSAKDKVEEKIASAKDKVEEKIVSAKDKAAEKIASAKEKYVEKRQAEIDQWNAELEDLDVKIKTAGVDAKEKLAHEEHIAALRQKRDAAKTKLAEIQAAGDDKWEDLKDGLESIWKSIKDGFEKVKAKF